MAEKLPRYRPLGVSIPSVPTVDYVSAGAAAARGWQSMSAALDKMSGFAFKRAEVATKREAEKFAYDNPITPEQITAAQQSGGDLDELIGDPDTVFGSTTRLSYSEQLRVQLEGEARKRIAIANAAIKEGGAVDVNDLRKQFDGMIQGHTQVISAVSPGEAYKYSARINALAQPTFQLAAEKIYKMANINKGIEASEALSAARINVEAIFKAGAGLRTKGGKLLVEEQAEIEFKNVLALAQQAGPEAYSQALKDKANIIREAKINALVGHIFSDEFSPDPTQRDDKVIRGEFQRHTALWGTLTDKDKAEVRVRYRKEAKARRVEEKAAEDTKLKTYIGMVYTLTNRLDSAQDGPESELIYRELERISAVTNGRAISYSQVRALRKPGKEKEADSPAYMSIYRRIQKGEIKDYETLEGEARDVGLSGHSIVNLHTKMKTRNGEVEGKILKDARTISGAGNMNSEEQARVQTKHIKNVELRYQRDIREWSVADPAKRGARPSRVAISKQLVLDHFNEDAVDRFGAAKADLIKDIKKIRDSGIAIPEYKEGMNLDDWLFSVKSLGLKTRDYNAIKSHIETMIIQQKRMVR